MLQAKSTNRARNRGFFASLGLASQILAGTLRLLRVYPKLIIPLIPVFGLVIVVEFGLLFVANFVTFALGMLAILTVAFCLMMSFAVSSGMLKQIDDGQKPSLVEAGFSTGLLRLVPRVLALSVIWFSIVLLLVIIEMIIRAALDRISDGLGDRVIRSIFGTIADALRMSGFMMVAIMAFEDVGLGPAFGRLRSVVKSEGVTAVGGLILTRLAASLIFAILYFSSDFLADSAYGGLIFLLMLPILACGWILVMYLEQLFAAGLYLYATAPDSRVVKIMLGKMIGRQIPRAETGAIQPAPEAS